MGETCTRRSHDLVLSVAALVMCAWCGWISGFHRTTAAAGITWLVTTASVVFFDIALRRSNRAGGSTWHLEPVRRAWPRAGRGGGALALRGVAPWLVLILAVTVWEVLGIDTGPRQYHLTISALAQAYRPLNAGLILAWILVGIGYAVAVGRAPYRGDDDAPPDGGPPLSPGHGGAFAMATGSLGMQHGAPALLLPQSPPTGVAFWILVPIVAVVIDGAARRAGGRLATAEEFVRFISSARLARYALIAAWVLAGYHLFAR